MQRVEVYVLDNMCEPVIGRDLIIGFEMQVDCGANQVHRAKDDSKVGGLMDGSPGSRVEQMSDVTFHPTGCGGTYSSTVPPPPRTSGHSPGSNTTSS